MNHADAQASEPGSVQNSADKRATSFQMRDRTVPRWMRIVSYIFTFGISLCVLSIAVMAVFFHALVVEERQLILSPLFALIGSVAVLGILFLEFSHSKALAGFRDDRRKFAQLAQGAIGAVVTVFLGLVHPFLAVPTLSAAGLSFGGQFLLAKYLKRTPLWDFNPPESVSFLIGRDFEGHRLATTKPILPELAWAVHLASVVLSGLIGLAVASWLVAQDILAESAILSVCLMSLWASHCVGMRALLEAEKEPEASTQANRVTVQDQLNESLPEEDGGLVVRNLSAEIPGGRQLLSEINLKLPPGSITGIVGETGGGKTLMLRALSDPFSLSGLNVTGRVLFNGNDLWVRMASVQSPQSAFLPTQPLIMPASGLDNLTCFHGELFGDRGRRYLEKLVFSSQSAFEICGVRDASLLPDTQKRCLALARAFLLSPPVYFLDRPEDGLPEKQILALLGMFKHETRLGRSIVLVTENRALMEACDKLVVLQEGRVIDYGDANETRARRSSGWMRFIGARQLETEDNLDTWVRSHFKRDGDEANRRKVCMIASEMLAFSCQTAATAGNSRLSFEFKHFEGHCYLKLQDDDPAITNAQLAKAQAEAAGADFSTRLSPLAAILRESLEVETTVEMDRRVLLAKIQTYDPRNGGAPKGARHAPQKA